LCSLAGCLLYTDELNVPPTVELTHPEMLYRGKGGLFTARATDNGRGRLGYVWYQLQVEDGQPCPASAAEARALEQATPLAPLSSAGASQEITLPKFGTFCVWVRVTDDDGASGFAGERFVVRNQSPTPVVKLLAPTPLRWVDATAYVALYSTARISADTSSDPEGDQLQFQWTITGRSGEPIAPAPCNGAGTPDQICHRLNATGTYRFELKVSDGEIVSSATALPLVVMPDAPPCIQQTEPPYLLPRVVVLSTERTTLSVLEVSDDGDPFPAPPGQASQTAFIWRYRYVGTTDFSRVVTTTLPSLSFARDTFRPGDELEVRLDVLDRVTDRSFEACGDQPECRMDSERECRQRVSWRVSYL
jgi:hypothetical protein